MYSSYSTLQRKQLTKQVYTDTQSTYLLVGTPRAVIRRWARTGKPAAPQVPAGGRSWPRPDRLGGGRAAGERGCGVHLHRLTYFAAALQDGAILWV